MPDSDHNRPALPVNDKNIPSDEQIHANKHNRGNELPKIK